MTNKEIERKFLFDLNTVFEVNESGEILFFDEVDKVVNVMGILLKNGYKDGFGHLFTNFPSHYTEKPADYPHTHYKFIKLVIRMRINTFSAIKYENEKGCEKISKLPDYIKEYKLDDK